MNLFELVLKQMRQRSLSTWLTIFSILLAVGLAISIMILHREGKNVFGQSDYGFDTVIGVKGSKLQLVLNSVYHLDQSTGNLDYAFYENLSRPPYARMVRWAVPFAVGDNYRGHRVVATLPAIFGLDESGEPLADNKVFQYRIDRRFELAEGRAFSADHYEAVIGDDTAKRFNLKLGDRIRVEHGLSSGQRPDYHDTEWTVVGILAPTRTANDRVVFIPLKSFYAIGEHTGALEQIAVRIEGKPRGDETSPVEPPAGDDNAIHLALPKEKWKISSILVRSRSPHDVTSLAWFINNGDQAVAANPALEMSQFFSQFLDRSAAVLLSISALVTIVAAVSILVSIYNSVSARMREIAILRALGATRARILALICIEAGLIGLIGGAVGLVCGHLLAAAGSWYLQRFVGHGLNWLAVGSTEWIYLGVVVVLSVLAGLVPALKAYQSPVAMNLVG